MHLQGIRQVGSKLLTIVMEGRVDIDVCGVPQSPQLPLRSRRHFPVAAQHRYKARPAVFEVYTANEIRTLRVTVAHADGGYASKQIQVSFPVHIPQPLHVALVDEYWFLIVGNSHGHGEAVLLADLQHSLFGHSLDKDSTQDEKRERWTDEQIDLTLNSSGLKSHGGISGIAMVVVLNADF